MRKQLFLLFALTALARIIPAQAQDSVRFNFTIGPGTNVTFSNTSVLHGDGVRKAWWTFGDGTRQTTTALAGTQHNYSAPGAYTVCLRIFKYTNTTGDSVLTGEACRLLNVPGSAPADSCHAQFTDTLHGGTVPLLRYFTAQPWHSGGKKPEQICWSFGDNHDTCISYNPSIASEYTVSHGFAQAGSYTVCVNIRYQGGCQSHYCRQVQVTGGDSCRADYTTEPVAATPLARRFLAQPWQALQKKPVRVCWNFGDGTDTCIQYTTAFNGPYGINHSYASYGSYNVCVRILYDGGCEKQKCRVLAITPPPADSCTVALGVQASAPGSLTRVWVAGPMPNRVPERICWSFGDGTDTCYNLPNPLNPQLLSIEHHYPAPGNYTACVRIRYAGGCEAQRCLPVSVQASAHLCGGYITDSLAAPATVVFQGFAVLSPNDHVISWQWSFGDGTGAPTQQASHTYAAPGNYSACLVIRTDLGCETRICKRIGLAGNAAAPLVLTPNPVTANLHAVFQSQWQEPVTISIYNANGILVRSYTRNAVLGTNVWDLDVASLPSGMYSVVVHSTHQQANAFFFKQ